MKTGEGCAAVGCLLPIFCMLGFIVGLAVALHTHVDDGLGAAIGVIIGIGVWWWISSRR